MLIGYARTSTVEQVAGLEAQCAAFGATGCNKLFSDQASSVGQRDQLAAVLEWVREGDTLKVTRSGRSC
jgi:DNA invertase Pin-like site-specific DNA recombinase